MRASSNRSEINLLLIIVLAAMISAYLIVDLWAEPLCIIIDPTTEQKDAV